MHHLGNCIGLKKVGINRLQLDALQAEMARLREALQTIVNADRSYPDKRIADDMQYCARAALIPT